MGWEGDDFEVDIDLGEIRKTESIGLDVLQLPASWIFLPSRIEFSVLKMAFNLLNKALTIQRTLMTSAKMGLYCWPVLLRV